MYWNMFETNNQVLKISICIKTINMFHSQLWNMYLVGGDLTILKKMKEFVSGKDDIPYEMENKKCLKQTTRY